nr:uncharacterized protein LOC126536194 isoform X2 [Dermacentor andersoni]
MPAGDSMCRMPCADEASWSSQSLSRSASPQHQSPIMTSCCFCCDTRKGSLATAMASIMTRGLTILGYYLMVTAPRYENTRLHKQDEKALINPHYVGIAMITESCIEIFFSVILLMGVIKSTHALGSAMGSWIGFFVSVYFLKCVLAYYHTLQSGEGLKQQQELEATEPLAQEQPHCSKNIA